MDGFNLFYGALKGTAFKWLDLRALCTAVLPSHLNIQKIKYFTADVKPRASNPGVADRQRIYLRALQRFDPDIEILKGKYKERAKLSPLLTPGSKIEKRDLVKRKRCISQTNAQLFQSDPTWTSDPGPAVHVINSEEKGTDVKIAVHLLNDAWRNEYDCCAIISNDSDLAEALRLVRQEHSKQVALITTYKFRRPVAELARHATILRDARRATFGKCLLPDPIPGTAIHMPADWR